MVKSVAPLAPGVNDARRARIGVRRAREGADDALAAERGGAGVTLAAALCLGRLVVDPRLLKNAAPVEAMIIPAAASVTASCQGRCQRQSIGVPPASPAQLSVSGSAIGTSPLMVVRFRPHAGGGCLERKLGERKLGDLRPLANSLGQTSGVPRCRAHDDNRHDAVRGADSRSNMR